MSIRVGFLGVAHMHAHGYAHGLRSTGATCAGVWDPNRERSKKFADAYDLKTYDTHGELIDAVDAVVVTSENTRHVPLAKAALQAGKHVLCEKPVVVDRASAIELEHAAHGSHGIFMTAFPCRFSPAYKALRSKVRNGEIGQVVSICATNRGRCPFDWFVQTEHSGGGAMIDHTVHVADLLRDLLAEEPTSVFAVTGNRMYDQSWEDTAMLSLVFPSGITATLDSSWSRPAGYKTWGDVTMTVVGTKGVLEMDMFRQQIEVYSNPNTQGTTTHNVLGFGSDLDRELVAEFLAAIREHRPPEVTCGHGIAASRVAVMGYGSASAGQPVTADTTWPSTLPA